MHVKILGSGCKNCQKLEEHTRQALAELGLEASMEKVADYPTMMSYGVMKTPALVVDEKVVISGRVPSADEIAGLLREAALP